MKDQFWILVGLFIACLLSAILGQDPRYKDLSVKDFARELDSVWDGSFHQQKIRAALFTGRPDLIRACIEHNRTCGYFEEELIKFPDGPEKEAILLLLLRTHDDLWRSFDYPYMGPRPITPRLKEPFSSFIQNYLPDHPMDDSQVTNREARLDLCDRLEAAMTGKPLPPKKTPLQSPPISQRESHPPPSPDKPGAGTDKAGTGDSPAASGTLPVPALWSIAAIALGAISLAWWLLKKQK